jgi:DNA-binding CsgD family transcriptional regulator
VNNVALLESAGGNARQEILDIIDAAYRMDGSDDDWLAGIARACRVALDRGFGVCAFQFRHVMGEPPLISRRSALGISAELAQGYAQILRARERDWARPFAEGPCLTCSQMLGQRDEFDQHPLMQRYLHTFGVRDSLWITALEPSGSGCGLHAGRDRVHWPSRAFRARWARIAAHLAAGARLRQRQSAGDPPAVEAVLSADGDLLHAEGPARDSVAVARLRHAVRTLESARNPLVHGDASVPLRPCLVAGRWSLLEQFESDGRRYILARENAPRSPGPSSFTPRERQVVGYAALGHDNKVIAYDLGIAHSTVKVLMARAAQKLGVGTRAEVIAAYLAECGASPCESPRRVDGRQA